MDPPPIKFKLDLEDFKSKLKEVLKVYIFNSLIILFFALIAYYLILNTDEIRHIVSRYRRGNWSFFLPLTRSNFNLIFWNYSLIPAIIEEVLYRGPLLVLMRCNFNITYRGNDLTKPFLIILALILNASWATTHTIFLPVFLAGLPLYWLVFKTKAIWTSTLCHCSFNLSIYFFLKIVIGLGLIR